MTQKQNSWKNIAIKLSKSQYRYIREIDKLLWEADNLKDWKHVMKARKYIRKLIRECKI